MTKSIQQVKQDLENLKSAVADTAIELKELHFDYLNLLSHSLKQQLIFACYQICTQIYPQAFLDLSLNAKQELQQNFRQITSRLKPDLLELINQQELEPEPLETDLMAQLIKNLPKAKKSLENLPEKVSEIDLEQIKSEFENIEFIEISTGVDNKHEPSNTLEATTRETVDFKNPQHLIAWHKQIERGVKKTLDTTSRKVNKYLQDSRIIPDRIPSKVIDVAMEAEAAKGGRSSSQSPHIPHVLHLAIETDSKQKSKSSSKPLQISLLRLRLAELEFSDHLLSSKRREIRNLMGKIKKLKSNYRAIKQQAAVIEAQAAWRSSWYED